MSAFIPIYPLTPPSGGSSTLAELTDVEFTSLANAEMLAFNATSGKWENIPAPTGTGSVTNVSGTAPIQVVTGTSTPVISIDAATTSTAGSMSGADKTKLDGIAPGATNYTHPANHAPSIITQDSSNRFVTDAEIAAWDAKQDELVSGTSIKTINSTSILGSGNIVISGGGGSGVWGAVTGTLSDQTDLNTALASKENIANKNTASGYPGLNFYRIALKNTAGENISYIASHNTAGRDYLFPDKDITVAGLVDINTGNALTSTTLQTARTINGVSFDGSANITINAVDSTARQATSGKDATGGYAGLTLFKLNLKNAANTFTNFLTNATTAARTWTMPDKDGTVAMLEDAVGFKNILINGEVVRINQRGVANWAAVANGAYGYDRWKKIDASNMTQIVEAGNFVPSATYTLSGTGVTTQQLTSPASDHWTLPNIPITATNVQLERGSIATPFENRPIGLELSLCQRYWQHINIWGIGNMTSSIGYSLQLPVTMRATPSQTINVAVTITDTLANFSQRSLELTPVTSFPDIAAGNLGNFTGLTIKQVYYSVAGSLNLSAEL